MRKLVVLLFFCLLLTGCLQSTVVISLNPDGSGTIEKHVIARPDVLELFTELARIGGESSYSVVDEEKLKQAAKAMGEGVELDSVEPLATDFGDGYHAVFSFGNIETLRLNMNPLVLLPNSVQLLGIPVESPEVISFRYHGDGISRLTVLFPSALKSDAYGRNGDGVLGSAALPDEGPALDAATIRAYYRDMTVKFLLRVNGEIVSTTASHVSGSTVTLMDIPFNRILESSVFEDRFIRRRDGSMEALRKDLNEIDGVQLESKDELDIDFR